MAESYQKLEKVGSMKAIVVHAFGGPEVLKFEDVPDPVPGSRQLLIRVKAAGINPVETYVRTGSYAIKPELPYVPGTDGAGEVTAVGDGVRGFGRGDRVYFCGTAGGHVSGAYAELTLCNPENVQQLPPNISFEEGAAIGVPYATACRALFERAGARAGETVLVHGASGGVGIACVQMARHAGLTVIGTAGTAEGLDLITREGATHAVNHRQDRYEQQIAKLTGGAGPNIILEMLANVNLARDLEMIARGGRIVVIGNRGSIEINPRLLMGKESSVTGVMLWTGSPEAIAGCYQRINEGLASGTFRPIVGHVLPLAQAAKAHELVLAPGAKGKIVLQP
jgi:NADPH2:quinone reductase